MHIVCPHCTTSYAINPATLGPGGRTVRCSRCKETWLARSEDAIEMAIAMPAAMPYSAQSAPPPAANDAAAEWSVARQDAENHEEIPITTHGQRLARLFRLPSLPRIPFMPSFGLPTACAAMGALILALMIWRAEVVRLLPQTATFYKMVGLEVNLRGLAFKDIKISNETVDGKPVLVIEGTIIGQTKNPVELPRLRFSVRDAQGAEIYAWNAVLEQPLLNPGERAYFKSRLASPPPEGRNIDVRFFNKRDLAGHA